MPDALLDDGMLDVLILRRRACSGGPASACRVLIRNRRDDTPARALPRSHGGDQANADLPRQVDGEMIESARSLTVTVRPGALTVRVPG